MLKLSVRVRYGSQEVKMLGLIHSEIFQLMLMIIMVAVSGDAPDQSASLFPPDSNEAHLS